MRMVGRALGPPWYLNHRWAVPIRQDKPMTLLMAYDRGWTRTGIVGAICGLEYCTWRSAIQADIVEIKLSKDRAVYIAANIQDILTGAAIRVTIEVWGSLPLIETR